MINLPKQERFATSKSDQRPKRLTERSAKEFARFVEAAAGFTDTKKALQKLIETVHIQTQNSDSQAQSLKKYIRI